MSSADNARYFSAGVVAAAVCDAEPSEISEDARHDERRGRPFVDSDVSLIDRLLVSSGRRFFLANTSFNPCKYMSLASQGEIVASGGPGHIARAARRKRWILNSAATAPFRYAAVVSPGEYIVFAAMLARLRLLLLQNSVVSVSAHIRAQPRRTIALRKLPKGLILHRPQLHAELQRRVL